MYMYSKGHNPGKGGGPILWGAGHTIPILLYLDVSCVYPVEYMYPECIYSISNASKMLCYIPREYMYLDILHVFYTYPKRNEKRVQDTFRIHIGYIKMHVHHVSCSLPMCHTGYIRDTCILESSSRYIKIQNYDTCKRQEYIQDT